MQKFAKYLLAVVLAALVVVGVVVSMPKVSAFDIRKDKNVESTEVITGDLFISGETVRVAGTVNGNVFAAGASIEITGKVSGNVFAAGSVITVAGDVQRSVMVAGSTVDVSGNVGRDVFAAGGQVSVNGKVTENVFLGGGTAMVKNDVGENLYLAGGQVSVLGHVGKDAFVSAGTANIEKSLVKGQLTLKLEDKAKRAEEMRSQRESAKKAFAALSGFATFMGIMMFVGLYIVGLLVLRFFPEFSAKMQTEISGAFAKNTGIGLLIGFATPIAVVILFVTLIGIPLAMVYIGALSLILSLSTVWGGVATGKYVLGLFKREASQPIELLIGQVVLGILCLIPVIGFFTKLVLAAVVLGAVVSIKSETLKNQ